MGIGVLIVDDGEDVRNLMRIILEAASDDVFVSGEAASGQEALDQLDECDPEVVLLDQTMPGISGLETARLIRERRPGQRMILCSAYLDDALREQAAPAGIDICLPKEHYNELPRAVRESAIGAAD